MKRNQLTAAFVRKVAEPGRYHDGMGLFLNVKPTGSKSWIQRITIRGKRRDIGLGSTLRVTLTEARKRAFHNWIEAREGGDPTRGPETVPTFAEAVEAVLDIHRAGWKGKSAGRSEGQWRASLRDYALPRLADMPVDRITTADVMGVLTPIWQSKHETARRVRQRIGAVMKWAVAQGYRQDNPAGDAIGAALPRNGAAKGQQRALPYSEVSGVLETVKAAHGASPAALALEFLMLTASRSSEIRGATWAEIDMNAAMWTVPGERMKSGRPHRVALSGRAMEILREAEAYGDGLLFPGSGGRPLSGKTLLVLLRDTGTDAAVHGFRSSFRDWAAERSGLPEIVAEHALAHVDSDRPQAAYRRTDLFEARRNLMQRWADYLDRDATGKVIPIHR